MLRNIFGSLLALIGAALAVWSPFRAWYGGRHGSDVRVADLFTGVGVTSASAALLGSLLLPLGFAALLTLLGVLMRSRLAVAAAGVLVLGVTVLWMVRQGLSTGSLTAGGDGLDVGVAVAIGGGILLLLGAAVMSGRVVHYGEPSPGCAPPLPPPPLYEAGRPYAPGTGQPYDTGQPCDAERPYDDTAPQKPVYRPEDDGTLTLPPLPGDRPRPPA
jgi:hypothetical protein